MSDSLQMLFFFKLENIDHVFWVCKSIQKIICWLSEVTKVMLGRHVLYDKDMLLYGPSNTISASVWARVWFLYVVTRKGVWNRRCLFIFEKDFVSEDTLLLKVKDEICLHLVVDLKRWSR